MFIITYIKHDNEKGEFDRRLTSHDNEFRNTTVKRLRRYKGVKPYSVPYL